MRQLGTPWTRIGINVAAVRAALEPEADRYIEDLKKAAFKEGDERTLIMDECGIRLINRLNDIADEHGMVGPLRGQFFAVWQQIKGERASLALSKIRTAALEPKVVIIQQRGGCSPIILAIAAIGLLLII